QAPIQVKRLDQITSHQKRSAGVIPVLRLFVLHFKITDYNHIDF
ncbi:MAG: hypothetical protein ACI9L9_002082, partial [Marivirga sp.]